MLRPISYYVILLFLIPALIPAFAVGFNDDAQPVNYLKDIPSRDDFLSNSKPEQMEGFAHSTTVRDNGEFVESIFFYSKSSKTFAGIFYFEDSTADRLEEDSYYYNDWFAWDLLSGKEDSDRFAGIVQRFGDSCVKLIEDEESLFSFEGDCSRGQITKKETEGGWAVYVGFTKEFEDLEENPLFTRWAYVDARKWDEKRQDQSEFYFFPLGFDTAAPLQPFTGKEPSKLIVNDGKIEQNNFLYTPNEIITADLEPNEFECADDTLEVKSHLEIYSNDDVANISVLINSDFLNTVVTVRIFDEKQNEVFSQTKKASSRVDFLAPLAGLEVGIYTIEAEFGPNGSKDTYKFGIGDLKVEQEDLERCQIYLLYDSNNEDLYIFGQIFDPSGFPEDSLEIFIDRDGDGGHADSEDLRLLINKELLGGDQFFADRAWFINEEDRRNAQTRINKLPNGYEILAKVPDVSKKFSLAFEQSDFTFYDDKKHRYPKESFPALPDTWAEPVFSGAKKQARASDSWIPNEIVVTGNLDVNLILVGDQWSEAMKNQVKENLVSEYLPVIHSEQHFSGIQHTYTYQFSSTDEQFNAKLWNQMEKNSKQIQPFYGEDDFDSPWGVAAWIYHNHTDWLDEKFHRFNAEYRLIDASAIEDFFYQELILPNPDYSNQNAANLIFIAGDPNQIEYIHNYYLKTKDPSMERSHEAVGLMGFGGNYNFYFFDLYAYPWDPIQGFPGSYDPSLINEYSNFHDIKSQDKRSELISNYVNNATALIITPSYVYPPVYKTQYLIDITIAASGGSAAISTTVDKYINQDKIKQELEALIPHSIWEMSFTLEPIDSRNLPSGLKQILKSTRTIPLFSGDSPTIEVVDSKVVTEQLVNWAITKESSDHRDFREIGGSKWTIPILIIIGERTSPIYIDGYGGIGLSPEHPDDSTQPCCALGVTTDTTVWADKVGVTDLIIHEVGHTLGLMHPFTGYDANYRIFHNEYFNWYESSMAYNSPQHGCGFWYEYNVEEICGNGDSHYTEFEKQVMQRGISAYLIRAAENNIYRTVLAHELSGTSLSNLQPEISNKIKSIQINLDNAREQFDKNNLDADDGAIFHALTAAKASEQLGTGLDIEYKQVESPTPEVVFPEWIKSQMKWWVEGSTSDGEFINSIQFLIKEKIIVIPKTEGEGDSDGPKIIPGWVKNTVSWWVDDQISNQELVNALQFLIKNGVIVV